MKLNTLTKVLDFNTVSEVLVLCISISYYILEGDVLFTVFESYSYLKD